MNVHSNRSIPRRRWLKLSAGALLAAGAWPGCARWKDGGRGGDFRFVVMNDCHYQSPQCPGWFERVQASVLEHSPSPEFCLMVGDLAEHGTPTELGPMRDVLRSFGMPYHAVPGNHDYVSDTDRSAWDKLFPRRLNYHFEHRGWQFIGLDSTEGTKWQDTRISEETLRWTNDLLPKLDPAAPTVLFTHFPLGAGVTMRPKNADELLDRFRNSNLVAIYNGHYHGFTEKRFASAVLTTNRCCSISRGNHDGTTEKGYFLCDARAGQIDRQFVQVQT